MEWLRNFENQGFVILDGGLATELERRGHDLDHHLWSARLLLEAPEEIRKVHMDFLNAGADCIISANYQSSVQGFMGEGLSQVESELLIQRAVRIAIEARDEFLLQNEDSQRVQPLVATSIGPYGAFLADGSEYRGDYAASCEEIRSFHESRWNLLQNSGADFFAIETIPSIQEAIVLMDILRCTPDAYAFISFSCMDGERISDGTPIADCAQMVDDCNQIIAVGVNCTAPRFLPSLIKRARQGAPSKPIVVYPNSGEAYDGKSKTWSGSVDSTGLKKSAAQWLELGARFIGGCCRTTPRQISEMRKILLKNVDFEDESPS